VGDACSMNWEEEDHVNVTVRKARGKETSRKIRT
jgi:hypothetical protein